MRIKNQAESVMISLLGYYEGKQTTRTITIELDEGETYDKVESMCMSVVREIYYNTNKDPFGENKVKSFTVKCKRKNLKVRTTLHFKAFVEVFIDEINYYMKEQETKKK